MMSVHDLSQIDERKLYTYADYLLWHFKERVELIRGKIFKMSPAPGTTHQKVSRELSLRIFSFFKDRSCEAFAAPFDVRLPLSQSEGGDVIRTVVQPDLCVICDNGKLDEKGCLGAPDLIVEILSPGNSKKEMREKYEVYEEAGVQEYWLINPTDRTALVYIRNQQGKFIGLQPLTEDQDLIATTFPDLSISLKEIFGT